jgi:hypothetical protein
MNQRRNEVQLRSCLLPKGARHVLGEILIGQRSILQW